MRHKIRFATVGRGGRLEIEVDGKLVFDETWTHSYYTPVSILKMIGENEELPAKLYDMIQESKTGGKRYCLYSASESLEVLFMGLSDGTWEVFDTENEEHYYVNSERELYEDMLLAVWTELRGY